MAILQAGQIALRKHHSGLTYLRELLTIAKSEIISEGYLREGDSEKISSAFYFWDFFFASVYSQAGPPEKNWEPSPSPDAVAQESDRRAALVALIGGQLERINRLKDLANEREELALAAESRRMSLPSADATMKLLRYEAHLDRQLYRAMDELERLQRQRRGKRVPPPLNINLGRRR